MPTWETETLSHAEPLVRNISDTALWAAAFRARESECPDALFRDRYARRLAGERGQQIAEKLGYGSRHTWSWVTRTFLVDKLITEQVRQGVDLVVNLAAGLDARPYRIDLPSSLKWVEVDLPGILAYKEEILGSGRPICGLERMRLDLANLAARRVLFDRLGARGNKTLIISEGLLVYLKPDEVASLATDLAAPPCFTCWVLDMVSPSLLRRLQQNMGSHLERGGAAMKFGPQEGPDYFAVYCWKPVEVHSLLSSASRLKRLPLWMRPFALLPESTGRQGSSRPSSECWRRHIGGGKSRAMVAPLGRIRISFADHHRHSGAASFAGG